MDNWTPTERALPPEDVVVNTMDSGGTVSQLKYSKNLWWHTDMSMYVYYTPKFWQLVH